MDACDVDTLIVGAGPVGLFLAAELRRRGRTCMLIERATEPSRYSKALAIMPGTMEMFERAGIADRFRAAANRIDCVRFVTPRAQAMVAFGRIPSAYNYVSILPQWKTQEIFTHRLLELRGEVHFGHTLIALTPGAARTSARIAGPQGEVNVTARYVAGCDGVYSTVRDAAGIAFAGDTYPGAALLADVLMRTGVPSNEARVHVCDGAVVTMFPISAQLRRIVVIAPAEILPEGAEPEWLVERLRTARYGSVEIERVEWTNAFRVHRRIAEKMRAGNIILAGDSVHTHSPVGGQGMNIGLHDAWNLAGTLVRVLDGEPDSMLDAYERERLAVAKRVLRNTDILTRALVHPNALLRAARERLAPRMAALPMIYEPVIRSLALMA